MTIAGINWNRELKGLSKQKKASSLEKCKTEVGKGTPCLI